MSNSKIALTSSMRSNLLTLQNTQKLFDKTQDKLSSGYKVNSAMDNPSSYFTAQSLNSRADDLGSLLDSIGQAISTLEVADQGITSLQDLVSQAKAVANSARDTTNVSASTKTSVKFDMDTLRSELVTNQVSGLTAGTSSMTVRTGKASEMSGTTNVREEMSLGASGVNLSGASAGSIKIGETTYKIDASGTTEQMQQTTSYKANIANGATAGSTKFVFKVSDYNATNHTATLTDKDGNVYANVKTDAGLLSGAVAATTDITLENAAAGADQVMDIALTATVDADGHTTYVMTNAGTNTATVTLGTGGAAATATGASVSDATIYVNNAGTVGDMAKTIQGMIGNDKIKVSVENENLQIKTLDTSSIEVTGAFADKFGLDTGATIKIAADDTAESLRQKIAEIDGVTAEFDKDGHMVIKSEQGDDMVISGELSEKLGVSGAATNGNNERAAYAKQFNDVMDQIDQLVQDTSYKGINLLNGDDLTVNFNESRTSSMELKGVTFNSTGLGFTRVDNEWTSTESIDKALDQVTKATSMLRAQASEFGQSLSTVQIREDFTTNMINKLTTGADKLTLADTNEEAANLLALQTRQSLATTSLSLANQSAQGVLRLF